MKSTESQLESAITELLGVNGYPHVLGEAIEHYPKEILTKICDTLLPKLISGELSAELSNKLPQELSS